MGDTGDTGSAFLVHTQSNGVYLLVMDSGVRQDMKKMLANPFKCYNDLHFKKENNKVHSFLPPSHVQSTHFGKLHQ